MDLKKIFAVSGKPGIFELKVQTRTGILAENLLDGKSSTIGIRDNVSMLAEIAIYTDSEEIKLYEVFKKIAEKESNGPAISHQANQNDLLSYFEAVLPNYDKERVYASNIKKVLQWYNLLQSKGNRFFDALATFTEEEATEKA
jgi:hypothetical protein